jgi:hypothetical protein
VADERRHRQRRCAARGEHAASEQDFTLGTAQLGAYKYTSKLVRVSLEFLQDVDWLDAEGSCAQVRGAPRPDPQPALHDRHRFLAAAGHRHRRHVRRDRCRRRRVTADELIDLQHSVDPAYRSDRSRWMMADSTLAAIRKLKDSQGHYLLEPDVRAGIPNTLLGYPVVINNDMAAMATGVKSILFGDFTAGYVVRDVLDVRVIRMAERYADYFQVGFVAFMRSDGLVQDSAAYRALTQA